MNDTTYASPFSWRYAHPSLRELFSERERRKLWRAVWVALAEAQQRAGLVSQAELDDLRAHAEDIDLAAALAIEREIGHDLMAEIRVYAKQATVGGGKLHLGATSMDIEDTVETFRLRLALGRIIDAVDVLLQRREIQQNPLHGQVAAVSVGIYNGIAVLDLDYAEDANAETDMNVVMNSGGAFIEIQGTAEGHAFRRHELDQLLDLAAHGIARLHAAQNIARGG